ncbi:oxidoreductase [Dictyobacter alpinus]|uniref:Oxidoreductase n=1 Tax=Dictyobacter alpinus TaxID=2014873 RepID=A0A402B1G2_9CHLR|nr:aldo/keto reductase [Dictyobacter alpinus]GCE25147.1 oxidoreductase [Dictyobacter alpinus]
MSEGRDVLARRCLGRSGLEVTTLGLGGAGIGGKAYGAVSDDDAIATVRQAVQMGVTYIDTSPLYGESERRIGLALDGGLREHIILSTKTGTHPRWRGEYSATATYKSIENSLRLLKTDYIDLALIHDPPDLQQAFGSQGALEALEDLKAQGVIHAIGLGVRDHALLRTAILSQRMDAILTYLDYNLVRTTATPLLDMARAYDVGVINGSPLVMGFLSGRDPVAHVRTSLPWIDEEACEELGIAKHLWNWSQKAQVDLQAVALQFSLRQDKIATTLVGAMSPTEVAHNVAACRRQLPVAIWEELERARVK